MLKREQCETKLFLDCHKSIHLRHVNYTHSIVRLMLKPQLISGSKHYFIVKCHVSIQFEDIIAIDLYRYYGKCF